MFTPVFEEALTADPLDADLVGRCCAFLEGVLAGEEFAAEGVIMMVAENFGSDLTQRALPYAGPLFIKALRDCGWLG
jgi:hypothetical protein